MEASDWEGKGYGKAESNGNERGKGYGKAVSKGERKGKRVW